MKKPKGKTMSLKKVSETPKEKKTLHDRTITVRLTPDLESYIEQVAGALTKQKEVLITKTYVVLKLMEFGQAPFEKHNGIVRKEKKKAS